MSLSEKFNKMDKIKRINFFWVILLLLTLLTTFMAESATPSNFTVLLVCLTIAIKGRFVMDEMMGLRGAIPAIRYTIYSYFILLPIFIALSIIFPDLLAGVTTING